MVSSSSAKVAGVKSGGMWNPEDSTRISEEGLRIQAVYPVKAAHAAVRMKLEVQWGPQE